MKHLKSSWRDLRDIFDRGITVKTIAEPLMSFDDDQDALKVRRFMERRDYDVVGVRKAGVIVGYVQQRDLDDGALGDYLLRFQPEDVLSESAPLLDVFERLQKPVPAFIEVFGQVGGIVTRGDLQKAPVRMWLFGLISLIEMQLLRIIREYYPDESWKTSITASRLQRAQNLMVERQRRAEAIDLADCLQLADKRVIVLKCDEIWQVIDFGSKESGERLMESLEELRNKLAHSQDIMTGNGTEIVSLITSAEHFLQLCEAFTVEDKE